ncbi:MAG: F0F1 ATP synthase subunit A [Gammaproteobacteria bacterium]|nr:F0F1 ATP synthase subunit A [Gammaproteobacteria bacterium]
MRLSPDQSVWVNLGWLQLNATVVTTWLLIALIAVTAGVLTRHLRSDTGITSAQSLLELLVGGIAGQIEAVGLKDSGRYLPFIGTLFIFIVVANVAAIIPGYEAPTGSLSTTAALALCVFLAVPLYGIRARGFRAYCKSYLQPTFAMLPFNIVSELSRTLALAVRLFGNIMSGALVIGIVASLVPLFFPIVFKALELITGIVQAYIFSVLATVYIAAATQGEA